MYFCCNCKSDLLQREEIRFMVERDGSAKGIVFSQFTSFLDLIHYSLIKVHPSVGNCFYVSICIVKKKSFNGLCFFFSLECSVFS